MYLHCFFWTFVTAEEILLLIRVGFVWLHSLTVRGQAGLLLTPPANTKQGVGEGFSTAPYARIAKRFRGFKGYTLLAHDYSVVMNILSCIVDSGLSMVGVVIYTWSFTPVFVSES